ncbi:hypothetical protein SADUNF_Sadunf10G0111100 [Salix dunnii]|uniref:Pectinesterase n=1 Tax=Salix dunnii TaxID=1413687 RepID=A0A835JN33_9ROSI|nr:hypothetical protein SADUNF_Sadunf10G0111100 [Salix dunnii]
MDLSSLPPFMSLKPTHIVAFATTSVITVSFSGHVDGLSAQTVIENGSTRSTMKVDINGDGDFKSVLEAINAVPENESQWIIIHVRKGVRSSISLLMQNLAPTATSVAAFAVSAWLHSTTLGSTAPTTLYLIIKKSLPSRIQVPWTRSRAPLGRNSLITGDQEAKSFVFNDLINGKEWLPVWKN